jgi:hypothetical protein
MGELVGGHNGGGKQERKEEQEDPEALAEHVGIDKATDFGCQGFGCEDWKALSSHVVRATEAFSS